MVLQLLHAWAPVLLILAVWSGLATYARRKAASVKTPDVGTVLRLPNHITLVRSADMTGLLRNYKVYIDGLLVGAIAPGAIAQFPVLPGPHKLSLKIDWCSSSENIFHTNLGDNLLVWCGATYNDWRCILAPFIWPQKYIYVRPSGPMNIQRKFVPNARVISTIPKGRVDMTDGDGHSLPEVGDLVTTDQCFTGSDGRQMVIVCCRDATGSILWTADMFETELEPL